MAEKHVSTLVIGPSGGQQTGSSSVQTTASSASSFTSSQSVMSTKSQSSSGTRTVSSSTTVKKSSSTSVRSVTSSTMSSSTSTSSSKNIAIRSSGDSFRDVFSRDFGVNVDTEMARLKQTMDQTVDKARAEMFSLMKLEKSGSSGSDLVKLDNNSIMSFVDKAHDDRLKFNFDVDEFESETISVKAVGNKIEVHGSKKVRKGDDETSEEFSRSYELPSTDAVDPAKVTSSFYKDGILTVELPFAGKSIEAKTN